MSPASTPTLLKKVCLLRTCLHKINLSASRGKKKNSCLICLSVRIVMVFVNGPFIISFALIESFDQSFLCGGGNIVFERYFNNGMQVLLGSCNVLCINFRRNVIIVVVGVFFFFFFFFGFFFFFWGGGGGGGGDGW